MKKYINTRPVDQRVNDLVNSLKGKLYTKRLINIYGNRIIEVIQKNKDNDTYSRLLGKLGSHSYTTENTNLTLDEVKNLYETSIRKMVNA